jgi:NAD(P)H dehydrogenase (quinone)
MDDVKVAVIFYSKSGINLQLAKWAAEASEENGAEVRLRRVAEIAPQSVIDSDEVWKSTQDAMKDIEEASSDDLDWADAVIFSSPTRFGVMASELKQFIDRQGGLWAQGKLMNKVVSAMASAQNQNGGQEVTIFSIYTTMMHWGAIIVPPGYTDQSLFKAGGNPYGTTVTQGQDGKMVEEVEAAVKHQSERTIQVANWMKKGSI